MIEGPQIVNIVVPLTDGQIIRFRGRFRDLIDPYQEGE